MGREWGADGRRAGARLACRRQHGVVHGELDPEDGVAADVDAVVDGLGGAVLALHELLDEEAAAVVPHVPRGVALPRVQHRIASTAATTATATADTNTAAIASAGVVAVLGLDAPQLRHDVPHVPRQPRQRVAPVP